MSIVDWFRNENNPTYEMSEYLYGPRHLFVLLLAVLACIAGIFIFRNKSDRTKIKVFKTCGYVLLGCEIAIRVVNLAILDTYTFVNIVKVLLPMEICSVVACTYIIAILTMNRPLLNFSIVCGLVAMLAFLLYPMVGLNQKYISFYNLYSIFTHVFGFIVTVLLISFSFVKFELKRIYEPYICFTVMFLYGALLNWCIFPGSNYMFMRNDPLSLNINFPYQILYGFLICLYILMFYLISNAIEKIRSRKDRKRKANAIIDSDEVI